MMTRPDIYYEYVDVNSIPLGKSPKERKDREDKIRRLKQNAAKFGIRSGDDIDGRPTLEQVRLSNDRAIAMEEELASKKLKTLFEQIKSIDEGKYDDSESVVDDTESVAETEKSHSTTLTEKARQCSLGAEGQAKAKNLKKKAGRRKKRVIDSVRQVWLTMARALDECLKQITNAKGDAETEEWEQYVENLTNRAAKLRQYAADPVHLQEEE